MEAKPNTLAAITNYTGSSGADTVQTKTLAADADQIHVLWNVSVSFSASNDATEFYVLIDGVKTYSDEIPAGMTTVYQKSWPMGLFGEKNQAMLIGVAAAGAGVTSRLNAQYS